MRRRRPPQFSLIPRSPKPNHDRVHHHKHAKQQQQERHPVRQNLSSILGVLLPPNIVPIILTAVLFFTSMSQLETINVVNSV